MPIDRATDLESWISDIYDPIQFQEFFFQVLKPGSGMTPYRSYKYQKEIAQDESEMIIINKARQTGMSTCSVLDALHRCILNPSNLDVFISLRQDQANELIYKAKLMIDYMKEPWAIPLVKKQESLIQTWNGARLMAVSAHESAGRGWSGNLNLDEFAHVPNDKQILQAAMSVSVREGWKIRMQSTPYGDRGVFADIVQAVKAIEMGNATAAQERIAGNWSLHEIHWTECPDLIEERIMERCFSNEMFLQEYCLEFLDETTSMITWDMLMKATDLQLPQYSLTTCPTRASGNYRWIGIDPATEKGETGFVATEQIGSRYLVRHVDAEHRTDEDIYDYTKSWYKAFKPNKIFTDETGMGAPITSGLKRRIGSNIVQGLSLSTPNKEKLVYNGIALFESSNVSIPDHEYLKNQLHSLEKSKTPIKGVNRFTGKSKGGKDDLTWAFLLSLSNNLLSMPTLKVEMQKAVFKPTRRKRYGYYSK